MALDSATVITTSLLFGGLFAALAWAWSFSPGSPLWRRTWAIANTLVLAGVVLYLGQGTADAWFSIVIANALILGGYLLLETGLRQFVGRRLRVGFLAAYLGSAAAGFVVFTFVWESYLLRTIVHSVLAGTTMLHMVVLLKQVGSDTSKRRVLVHLLQGALLLVAFGYLVRLVFVVFEPAQTVLENSWALSVLFLFVSTAMAGWTLGFVALDFDRTQRELEKSLATRDRMFTLIAHDLRGPLGNLMMMLRVLKDGDFGPSDTKEALETASAATDQTYSLVENLLGWAQVQKGGLRLEPVTTSLAGLVEEATRPLAPIAVTKEIELVLNIPAELMVTLDVPTMTTVVRNLVSNALKFTPRHGRITVELPAGKALGLVVRDTGPGFPPGMLARLRDGKLPVSTVGSEGEIGTGLGLPLCQDFVRLNGGTLHLASSVDGTEITITWGG